MSNNAQVKTSTNAYEKKSDIFWIREDQIIIEPGVNKREDWTGLEELGDSIMENGILVPLHVVKVKGEDKYILKNGERRIRSLRIKKDAGIDISSVFIPVLSKTALAPDQSLLLQLLTNEGKRFNPAEEAEVYAGLQGYGWDIKMISKKTGKSEEQIKNLLLLANAATKNLKDKINAGEISATLVIQELKTGKNSDKIVSDIDIARERQQSQGKIPSKITKKHITPSNKISANSQKIHLKELLVELLESAQTMYSQLYGNTINADHPIVKATSYLEGK